MKPFGRRRRDTAAALVACQTCGFASPPGTPTCPYCGVDPSYRAPVAEPVAYDALGHPVMSPRMRIQAVIGVFSVFIAIALGSMPGKPWSLVIAALFPLVLCAVGIYQMVRHYRPRRAATGTLREAERTLDAALADARERWDHLGTLHRHAPASGPTDATRTLDTAHRVLAARLDARLDALERARFDLRLVWWKNRVDLALARSSAGLETASATLTTLRDEAARVLVAPATGSDTYADVRPRLDAARAALDTLVGRLFAASVAEAVAGITAPLDGVSVVRADVEAALDGLAAITAAAPAAARAADLTRESARLSLEADDLGADLGGAPDTSAPSGVRVRG